MGQDKDTVPHQHDGSRMVYGGFQPLVQSQVDATEKAK